MMMMLLMTMTMMTMMIPRQQGGRALWEKVVWLATRGRGGGGVRPGEDYHLIFKIILIIKIIMIILIIMVILII